MRRTGASAEASIIKALLIFKKRSHQLDLSLIFGSH
jgi:hypothetical protein